MRAKLSSRLVADSKPAASPYEVHDTDLKGLLLRVQPSGVKSFIVTWGRGKRKTLGRHPVLTVAAARHAAMKALTEALHHGAPLAVLGNQNQAARAPLTLGEFISGDYGKWAVRELKTGQKTLKRLCVVYGRLLEQPLDAIDGKSVEDIITARRLQGISAATTNRELVSLKGVFSRAEEWKLIGQNPVAKIKLTKNADRSVVRFLSPDEEIRLRAALNAREAQRGAQRLSSREWHKARGYDDSHREWPEDGFSDHLMPMVLLALNTGLRRGELFNLAWKEVNLQARILTVLPEKSKSGKPRHVPLNTEAHDALSRWIKQGSDSGLVFPGRNGRKFDNINKSWSALTASAQVLDFRFHDLRHTFASKLVMRGVDLNTVRELLGHSDLTMTLRYAHLAPVKLAEAVALL